VYQSLNYSQTVGGGFIGDTGQ